MHGSLNGQIIIKKKKELKYKAFTPLLLYKYPSAFVMNKPKNRVSS